MSRWPARFYQLCVLLLLLPGCGSQSVHTLAPPVAKMIPRDVSVHGDLRIDNYYWLRDDSRSDPQVLQYLEAESAYANAALAHTAGLQARLFAEITQGIDSNDVSVPYFSKGYWYYQEFKGDQEYPVYLRRKDGPGQPVEQLLDVNQLARGEPYFELGDYAISPDNRYLAYSADKVGRGLYTIRIVDLSSGEYTKDIIGNAEAQLVWANDSQSIFYIAQDTVTLLGNRVYRHRLGTAVAEDELKFEETDSSYYLWLYKSQDDSDIFLFHQSISETAVSTMSADDPQGQFTPFYPRQKNHRYYVFKSGSDYFVLTNWQAKGFRLMRTTGANSSQRERWEEVIPHRPGIFLQSFHVLPSYYVLMERELASTRIRVINRRSGEDRVLDFDDPVFHASFGADPETQVITGYNHDPEADTLRVAYSSLTTPPTLYEFNLVDGSRIQLKQRKPGNTFAASNYRSERIFVTARDGTSVPVSLAYRKDKFQQDGSNPVYQYAYGAYGLNQEPEFWPAMVSLMDRGFVYAIAHVRGGSMMGPDWYLDGKVLTKKNSFEDFIDVTHALVARGYADKDKVFASGASAGGTLTAVVATSAPELYRGVVMGVPFVDVVTTMLDESIPLVTNEYEEWGNPRIPSHYQYMRSYSPYDQITARDYTNMLVTTGLHDSQVQYYEPAKFVAKMRALKTDNNLLLFPVDMTSGHGGASGRFRAYRKQAFEFAFILDLLGVEK